MATEAVWGLDIGQCALKAVKGRLAGQLIEVLAFDHIEYRQPLSTAGTDSSATIRDALQTFLSRNDVDNCAFTVSIAAGRSALIRFIKLPPVDRKKVPDIVRYEATQQIPFPLEDVIWDHQLIDRVYAPGEELEVGIFAMRREAIFDFLSNLMVSGVEVENIQLTAVALFNCVHFDQPVEEGAVMAVDIGAENTNLVVVDGNTVWTRALPIGGNDFTRAIATKYGLEFEQAEQLKRSMDRSKKAQEIFEALRPSLRSLLDEIQRSAGYYRSLHKSAKFVKLIGFGSGFRMYGVQRFLEAGLAYPVEVFQKTNNIIVDGATNQQFFRKSAPAFGAALGLVAQAVGVGAINTTLMPPAIVKERILKKKRPMLIAATVLLAGAFLWPMASAFTKATEYDITGHPVSAAITGKRKAQETYEELLKVDKWQREQSALVSLMEIRKEQVTAFDAFVASLPANLDHPVYIRSLALDSGNKQWVEERLIEKQTESGGARPGLDTINVVKGDDVISRVAPGRQQRTASTAARALTPEQEAEAHERRQEMMIERQDAMIERRLAMAEERAAGGGVAAGPQQVRARAGKLPQFGEAATLVNVMIETSHPGESVYIRALCDELKKYPGVMYCDYVYAASEEIWENPTTKVRESGIVPRGQASDYVKTKYTYAFVQWVYKEGSTAKAAAAAAPAAPRAAAMEPESE